jgi:hypothetical protein
MAPTFYFDIKQGSDEWYNLRRGKATASNFSRIITEVKGEYAAGAKKYAREVAIQRMLDEDTEHRIDHLPDIMRGKLLEPDAVEAYHRRFKDTTTDAIGLVVSEDGSRVCSPDRTSANRLLGLEVKCPGGPTLLEYIENNGPGRSYIWQVVGSMLVSQFEIWDFWAYHTGLNPVHLRYDRRKYERELELLDNALVRFEGDVQMYCDMIRDNGWEEPIGRAKHVSAQEFDKLLAADPGAWAI